jgi:hypothetical protein
MTPFAQKAGGPAHLPHSEVGAGDPAQRLPDLLYAERLVEWYVFSFPVPDDRPVPAVAERGEQDDAGPAQVCADGGGKVLGKIDVGQHDVGAVGRSDEPDPR